MTSSRTTLTSTTSWTAFWIALATLLLLQIGLASPAKAFVTGDVFWAPGGCGSPCGVFDITGGGSITSGDLVGATADAPGQITWSADLQTLYVTEFGSNRVLAISSAGAVSTFATGISGATGLLRLADGRLLAVSYSGRAVFDISAGGDFSSATAYATGFSSPRNLLQLANGTILLADQGVKRVFDITGGGDFSGAAGFAYGFSRGPYDLVQDASGEIFASTRGPVFNITSGGDFSAATAYANGVSFIGLTIDGDQRLLAGEFSTGEVFDISAGGDFSEASAFAQGIPGFGDTSLDTTPAEVSLPTPPAVPGLGLYAVAILISCLGGFGLLRASTPKTATI